MSSEHRTPIRSGSRAARRRRRRGPSRLTVLLVATAAIVAAILLAAFLAQKPEAKGGLPDSTPSPTPPASTETLAPTPLPTDTATPSRTPEPSATAPVSTTPAETSPVTPSPSASVPAGTGAPAGSYDFSQPAPEAAAVEAGWFDDVVFMGDSRTDGLRLYGGITGADFIYSTGITVFDINTKEGVRIDGEKYTMMEALGLEQYGKVYVMLGVNELGYFDNDAFANAYSQMVDDIRAIQPNAVIYIQNLVSVNPDVCKANNQPYYVTNEKIAEYNAIIADIAREKHAVLVDVNAALVDGSGILPAEGTTDGVHFTKDYYVKWYDYLKVHTVDPDLYWAGQTAVTEEGA